MPAPNMEVMNNESLGFSRLLFWGAAISVLVLACVLLTIIYNLFFSPLARFPGPKLWAISSIPCRLSILRGRHHLDVLDLYEKYGSVVRLGPNELAFNNPQAWRDIYAHRQLNGCLPKDRARYRPAPNGVDSLVTLIDNDVHASHRKMLAHCFSDRSLREQEDLVQVYVDKLNKCLRYLINSGQAEKMDIKAWMNCTTIDVLGDLMFGESFNCLEDRNVHPWVGLIFDSVKAVTFFTILSDFPIVDKLLPLLLPKKMKQIMLDHLELGMQKVDRRMSKGITRPDFMSAILQNGVQEQNGLYDKGKRVMTKEEIYANAVLFIAAGSESSATLLSGVIFYLCKNPDKKNRLLEEIRTPFSYDSEITFTSTATLRYLKAVIEEGLRLYPPFVTVLSRECPMNGAIIDGHFVPEKTVVGCHHYASYHSPANFALPDQFEPERWLGADPRFMSDKKGVFNPFSLGPRDCLGKNLAYHEIRLTLAKLLFNFDIELCSESATWNDQRAYSLWEKPPLMVRLVDRFQKV